MPPDLFELLPDIVLFVAVARAKNFSRAAKALGMPVSTLSRRIADFEDKLGAQLLHRTTRQVELTGPGSRYFERCQLLVEAAEAAQAELRGETEQPRGHIKISATQDFGLTYLRPVLADFASHYPDITFELDLSSRSVDLIAEGFDIAIRMGPLPDSQLHARNLGSILTGLYAAPVYLERAGTPRIPADLAEHQCLRIRGMVDSATRWTFTREKEVEAVEVQGRFVVNGMRFLLELAAAGYGIVLVDNTLAHEAWAAGTVQRVLTDWTSAAVPVHALTPSKLPASRTRLFLDYLRDQLRVDSLKSPPIGRGGMGGFAP
jgi:DNA-binding transcriptional LysR family regulator